MYTEQITYPAFAKGMEFTMDDKSIKKHPSEDAFLTNPIASNQDTTGFVPTIPQDEYEARSYKDIRYVPVTHLHMIEEEKKKKK